MTPPSSIEEATKRVRELYAKPVRGWSVDAEAEEAELAVLVPQIAQWVEKALPVIEAARRLAEENRAYQRLGAVLPDEVARLTGAVTRTIAALDALSSLAAEGTPRDAEPPHKGQQACRCKGPNFCTCDDATCWCNWTPDDDLPPLTLGAEGTEQQG
jgi:hypothetical protein